MRQQLGKLSTAKTASLGLFVAALILLHGLHSLATWQQHRSTVLRDVQSLQMRLLQDLSTLHLSHPLLKSASDQQGVKRYMQALNQQAEALGLRARIRQLQDVRLSENEGSPGVHNAVDGFERQIPIEWVSLPVPLWSWFSPAPWLFAAILAGVHWYQSSLRRRRQRQHIGKTQQAPMRVSINLHKRTLAIPGSGNQVALPNKPFCFYLALLEYCAQHPDELLNHSKSVPEELLKHANRYFSRLLELGHTRRKRPDFNANLDKMLSEIRAVLDQLFTDVPEQKAVFYPPKAQGQGSRSKVHSYGISPQALARIDFIGR